MRRERDLPLRLLLILAPLVGMGGCDRFLSPPPQSEATRTLPAPGEDLAPIKAELARLSDENKALSDRMDKLESQPSSEAGAPFVLWENWVQLWPQVLGYRPDKPLSTFPTLQACQTSVSEFVQAQAQHSEDLRSYQVTQGEQTVRITYACLPSGVDPRTRR